MRTIELREQEKAMVGRRMKQGGKNAKKLEALSSCVPLKTIQKNDNRTADDPRCLVPRSGSESGGRRRKGEEEEQPQQEQPQQERVKPELYCRRFVFAIF